jgi:hypothetical protein
LLIAIALAVLALPGAASAADGVFWSNVLASKLSHANLDGSGGGDLGPAGLTPEGPTGVAIDAAANRIYWAEGDSGTIAYANLDGSGRHTLNTTGAPAGEPAGLAIDPIARRLYWANPDTDTIAYAGTDGSGGGTLNTTGATVSGPTGIAFDLNNGRVYWANSLTNTIAYTRAAGGEGGTLMTTGAEVKEPQGVAIDLGPLTGDVVPPNRGSIYWVNKEATKGIPYAKLDGSGGGVLSTAGATMSGPKGVAIDAAGGRIYWANSTTDAVSYARLDGSGGGGELNTAGATVDGPAFLALLRAPEAAGAPVIEGQGLVKRPLFCRSGSWAGDDLGAFLSREPQTVSYSWQRNGKSIPGAEEANYRPTQPGIYVCLETATNAAGSSSQASAELNLERGYAYANGFAPVHGRRALVTLSCTGDDRCKGLVKLIAHIGYKRVVYREGHRQVIRRRALFPIGKGSFSIFPGRTRVVHVKLKSKGARLLRHRPGRRWHVRLLGRDVAHRGLMLKMQR